MIQILLRRKQAIALSVIFFLVGLWAVPHHEMWRDELQAWLLARDSRTVIELVQNLNYEGHPGFWHLLLMPLTRVFESPEAMQYLNLLIATATIYILAGYSPFTWPQNFLLAFGYYFFYEYGVIARNYSIGVLLVFVYCALFSYDRKRYLAIAITLFLMSHTSVLGLILAIALFAGLLIDEFIVRRELASSIMLSRSDYIGLAIVILGFVSAIVQLKPPEDSGFAASWTFQFSFGQMRSSLATLIDAYFPIPKIEFGYWNKSLLLQNNFTVILFIILSLSIFLVFARSLCDRPSAVFVYVFATFGLLSFYYAKYIGSWRHHGFLFVALIAALWIAPSCKKHQLWVDRNLPSLPKFALHKLFVFILVLQGFGAAIAMYQDYEYPFSQAKDTAKYIRDNQLQRLEIIGHGSPQASAVAGYLNPSRFYYPDAARYGSFVRWDRQRSKIGHDDLISKAYEIAMRNPEGGLLVLNCPIEASKVPNLKLRLLYISGPSVVGDESFYIYHFEVPAQGLDGSN